MLFMKVLSAPFCMFLPKNGSEDLCLFENCLFRKKCNYPGKVSVWVYSPAISEFYGLVLF